MLWCCRSLILRSILELLLPATSSRSLMQRGYPITPTPGSVAPRPLLPQAGEVTFAAPVARWSLLWILIL